MLRGGTLLASVLSTDAWPRLLRNHLTSFGTCAGFGELVPVLCRRTKTQPSNSWASTPSPEPRCHPLGCPSGGINTQISFESQMPQYLSLFLPSPHFSLQEEIGPRRGWGAGCPDLPWAQILTWAYLCFSPAPRGPHAVVGDEIPSWW